MNPAELDLNLLRVLDALLRERHLTRAGNAIGMTQPAVSKALRRLRRFFNDDLLVRVGREYELTPLGRELATPVADALKMIENTVQRRPSFDPSTDRREFRIASSEYSSLVVLRRFMEQISREAPGVTLRVSALDGRVTIEQIFSGELDLGIWRGEIDPHLSREVLYQDRMVCAVWRGNPIEHVSLEEFNDLPHLVPDSEGRHFPQALKPTWWRFLDGTTTSHKLDSGFLRLFLLRGTTAVSLTQEKFARELQDVAEIRLMEAPLPPAQIDEMMFWHPRNQDDPAHQWLRTTLLATAKGC